MNQFLSGFMLLVLCCPTMAFAAAPTPQGIADIERLLGFDVLYEHTFDTKIRSNEQFESLVPKERACFFGLLRAQMHSDMNKTTSEMFVDEQTVTEWMKFSGTAGGIKIVQAMRAIVVESATGLPAPNMEAVQAGMSPNEKGDVALFLQSPAADVLRREHPEVGVDPAAVRQAAERCGILPGKF